MKRTLLRCHNCGSRAEVELSELESETLRSQGYLNRNCRECGGTSHWEPYETSEAPHSVAMTIADRGRILLIDDDEDILTVLTKILSRQKFDIITANSARRALTLLARGDYDVVFSDIRMPEFDGKQLLAFLDEHMPEAKERVVFITGDTGNPDTMEFLAREGRPYLTKPIEFPALMRVINQFIAQPVPVKEEFPRAKVVEAPPPPPPPRESTPEKSPTEQALSYAVIALREEVQMLKRTLDDRNAEVEALRRELGSRETDVRGRLDDALRAQEELRKELAQAQEKAAATEGEAAQARAELDQVRGEIEPVRAELEEARGEIKRARAELDQAHSLRARAEGEASALEEAQQEFARREADWRAKLEAAERRQEEMRAEAEAERTRARDELAAAREQAASAAESLRKQLAELEAELTQGRDEVARAHERLRQEHEAAPVPTELLAAAADTPEKREALQHERKRQEARWEALREQLETAQSKALKLEATLRQFYLSVVNPLTVAVASADLAASSSWLSPRDRENIQLLKHNMDSLLESIKALKKEMHDLGIEIS